MRAELGYGFRRRETRNSPATHARAEHRAGACHRSTRSAVLGPDPSSAITTSKPRSLWRDKRVKTASSASSRSYVVTMTEMRSGTSLPLRTFILHALQRCDSVRRVAAQHRGNHAANIGLHPRLQRGREDRGRGVERAVGRRDRGRRIPAAPTAPPRSRKAWARASYRFPFHGFGDLRNRAIAECRHEWIFSLDSDERCTPEARDEMLAILSSTPAHDAYLVPRRNYMMGRWIKGRAGIRTFASRSSFARARCATTAIPCTKATSF